MQYKVLIVGYDDTDTLQGLSEQFSLSWVATVQEAFHMPNIEEQKLIVVVDTLVDPTVAQEQVKTLKHHPALSHFPVVVLAREGRDLDTRLAFYDAGCDDHIHIQHIAEIQVRLMKAIFNRIANEQLKHQLNEANEMAYMALSGTSDLGVNIQFLLDINQCENLDQAGLRLFQALKDYGVSGSLQMRSRFGVKNLEANGMAKDLESTLLDECKDKGRYVDFGRRSIMNYGCVSLLVRNMPLDDPQKYGALKDNLFSMLQGLDARIGALDNVEALQLESQLVARLTSGMTSVMDSIERGYHDVMVRIADTVEDIADGIEREIQFLGMDECQEQVIQQLLEQGIESASQIFNDGLKLDHNLTEYISDVGHVFASGDIRTEELTELINRTSTNT